MYVMLHSRNHILVINIFEEVSLYHHLYKIHLEDDDSSSLYYTQDLYKPSYGPSVSTIIRESLEDI